MTNIFKNTVLLIVLFSIAPAHTKQISRPTIAQPTPIIPTKPTQPIIPVIPAPVQPAPLQPIIIQPQPDLAHNTWTSSAGLVYKSGKNLPNRINHVLAHAKANPIKPSHSVFSFPEFPNDPTEYHILDVIDEAWRNKGNPQPNPQGGDTYIINMGRIIGTKGETKIQINTYKGKSEIVSAYPVQ